ncbi:phage tail tube protein [Methylobacterium sp. CM6257]
MAIITASGTKIAIGPVATDAMDTAAEYAAATPYTEIAKVESYGDFGDESAAVTLNTVGEGRIEKAKGSRDAGTLALTVAYVPDDPGQIALEAAEKSIENFAFRVTFPDGGIQYFRGLVMSRRRSVGSADNVIKRVFNIGINSEIIDVAPTT